MKDDSRKVAKLAKEEDQKSFLCGLGVPSALLRAGLARNSFLKSFC